MAGRRKRTGQAPGGPARPKRFPFFLLGVLVGALAAGLLAGSHPQFRPAALRPTLRAPLRTPARQHTEPPLTREHPGVLRAPARNRPPLPEPGVSPHPRVAVIFDDAGYSLRAAREVLALPRPVTISVLPDLPFSAPIAEEAAQRGVQVMLHLPMQPENPALDPGPGRITSDMTDDAIARTVASDFAAVPGAVGANNHMGSRGTADPRVMRAVLRVVKTRAVFFVDSLTSPRSVAAQTARSMGVPTAVRAVFLDGQDNDEYVRAQFHTLMRTAQTHGQAIAIGHVGKVTARVLREMLPEFDEAGIRFVPVSALVR
jgi:uncharacterized protein